MQFFRNLTVNLSMEIISLYGKCCNSFLFFFEFVVFSSNEKIMGFHCSINIS